ncbi:MAG: NAD(P)-dependent oxidoreductase [Acidimicrobiia bacterium]|nr:NAD(P)-dependent oxidoreductase [Acidimicrobiia bacterium]
MSVALVIGARGFVGTYVAEHLGSEGWDVIRSSRSISENHDDHHYISVGSDLSSLTRVLRQYRPEVVFNLAASGVGSSATAHELDQGNAGVVRSIMRSVDPMYTRLVLHAGSWSQYGSPASSEPLSEDHPRHPTTAYGHAKDRAEQEGRLLSETVGVPFVTLRLFNVYGHGEATHRLIPSVVRAGLTRTPIDLTDGRQVRDFVHATDVAAAFCLAAESDLTETNAFNVGTGIGTPVRDVVLMAANELGIDKSLLRFGAKPSRQGEPVHVVANASVFEHATGWHPSIPLVHGVVDTVRRVAADRKSHG